MFRKGHCFAIISSGKNSRAYYVPHPPTLLTGYDQVKSWTKPCQSEETFHLVKVYTIPLCSEMWETRAEISASFLHSPEWQNKFQNKESLPI
jgi:hypothetical protein